MAYWLMKSEPDTFSIDDLKAKKRENWDGVRNYLARNHLRAMQRGDQAFFYHSSCAVPGIVGITKIIREAFPDPTQFDPASDYHDPKSDPDDPRWSAVEVAYGRHTKRVITLTELKSLPALEDMPLIQRGARLSVMPVTEEQWQIILAQERVKGPPA